VDVVRVWVLRLVVCVMAVSGSAAAVSFAATQSARCGDPSGRTLAHTRLGRVYVVGDSVFGCATGGARPVRLGSNVVSPGSAQLGPLALAGKIAAYGSRTLGVDTSSAEVIVRRLSDGRVLSVLEATDRQTGPESIESVGSIAVRSDGAVAWIGSSQSIVAHRRIIEVLELAGGSVRRLDQGSGIHARSLSLSGARLTWTHGSVRRSAMLS
jgi:hypothetical protein